MKRVLALVVVLAALTASAGPAWAGRHHLTIPQARHETREAVKIACRRIRDCVGYRTGRCRRNAASNVGCIGGVFAEGPSPGEEEMCGRVVRWGINSQGQIAFRGGGPLRCFADRGFGIPLL